MLFTAAAVLALPLSVALAQVTAAPVHGPDASMSVSDLVVGKVQGKSATNVLSTVYDNTSSTPQTGVSSTDLTSTWGDELFTTGMGLLSTHKFTLYNASGSAGSLLSATVNISFYDAPSSTFLGAYGGSISFGSGLPVGSFSIITASGLDPLLINLNSTDLVVLQTVTAKTGTANRLGIVSLDPVLVGSSPASMYIQSATIAGGVPGFYNLGVTTDVGNFIGVNPPPVSTHSKTWGTLKKLYH
jgi:hypothetical protein